jgi:hypothetical protein
MAKRSRQTFQKLHKEKARQQKQQAKAARRLQAKQRRADAALEMAGRQPGPAPAPADHVGEQTSARPRQAWATTAET